MACSEVFDEATAFYVDCLIEEDDLLLMYEMSRRKAPVFQYWRYENIVAQLEKMTNDECKAEFRFSLPELPILAQALRIPEKFTCPNGTVDSGMEGLCILLKRFAYPNRYSDMIFRCGRSASELSLMASVVTDFIYNTHGYLLRDLNQPWLQPERLEEYA